MDDEIKKDSQTHTVSVEGVVLSCVLEGVVSSEFTKQLKDVGERSMSAHVTSSLLVDIQKAGRFSKDARKDIVELLQNQHIHRSAFCGGNSFVRGVVGLLIKVVKTDNVKIFLTKKEALQWLTSA